MKALKDKFNNKVYLTDGGLETELIYNYGIDLPHFAAFPLVQDPVCRNTLADYYRKFLEVARINQTSFILESPTWRANPDWGYKMGYSQEDLLNVNKESITFLRGLCAEYEDSIPEILISGCIGPRGDGYMINVAMSTEEAAEYHEVQVKAFKESGADFISAITMTNVEEASGIVQAARKEQMPVVISFTVETNGTLPSGESLSEAIASIDRDTDKFPLHYMVNCAHPSHFTDQLNDDGKWLARIAGIRANASCKSHAELDAATVLDRGDAHDLGKWYGVLRNQLPELRIFGGCCGTDESHVASICHHVLKGRTELPKSPASI